VVEDENNHLPISSMFFSLAFLELEELFGEEEISLVLMVKKK